MKISGLVVSILGGLIAILPIIITKELNPTLFIIGFAISILGAWQIYNVGKPKVVERNGEMATMIHVIGYPNITLNNLPSSVFLSSKGFEAGLFKKKLISYGDIQSIKKGWSPLPWFPVIYIRLKNGRSQEMIFRSKQDCTVFLDKMSENGIQMNESS